MLQSNPNLKGPRARQTFEQVDINNDNTICLGEFSAAVK